MNSFYLKLASYLIEIKYYIVGITLFNINHGGHIHIYQELELYPSWLSCWIKILIAGGIDPPFSSGKLLPQYPFYYIEQTLTHLEFMQNNKLYPLLKTLPKAVLHHCHFDCNEDQ